MKASHAMLSSGLFVKGIFPSIITIRNSYDIGKAWTDSDDVQLRYAIDWKCELRQPQLLSEAISIVVS